MWVRGKITADKNEAGPFFLVSSVWFGTSRYGYKSKILTNFSIANVGSWATKNATQRSATAWEGKRNACSVGDPYDSTRTSAKLAIAECITNLQMAIRRMMIQVGWEKSPWITCFQLAQNPILTLLVAHNGFPSWKRYAYGLKIPVSLKFPRRIPRPLTWGASGIGWPSSREGMICVNR